MKIQGKLISGHLVMPDTVFNEPDMDVTVMIRKSRTQEYNPARMQSILHNVSIVTRLHESVIISRVRKSNIKNARFLSMYICKKMTTETLLRIAQFHGYNNDHASVIHACNAVESVLEKTFPNIEECQLIEDYERVMDLLNAKAH